MASRAQARFVRIAPRKARQVVDLIRGKSLEEALRILTFVPKRAGGREEGSPVRMQTRHNQADREIYGGLWIRGRR